MNKIRMPDKKYIFLFAILLIAYNVIVFALTGFDHGKSFWISYAFMIIAFAVFAADGIFARIQEAKDYLLGIPAVRHASIYFIAELIASVAFMALDSKDGMGRFSLAAQTLILAVHAAFVILCLTAKEKVENIQEKTKASTGLMKSIKADAEMLLVYSYDDELKKAFGKYCEAVKYSDVVSNPALEDLENKLSVLTENSKQLLREKDKENALRCCEELMLTLEERNKKCKLLK